MLATLQQFSIELKNIQRSPTGAYVVGDSNSRLDMLVLDR